MMTKEDIPKIPDNCFTLMQIPVGPHGTWAWAARDAQDYIIYQTNPLRFVTAISVCNDEQPRVITLYRDRSDSLVYATHNNVAVMFSDACSEICRVTPALISMEDTRDYLEAVGGY